MPTSQLHVYLDPTLHGGQGLCCCSNNHRSVFERFPLHGGTVRLRGRIRIKNETTTTYHGFLTLTLVDLHHLQHTTQGAMKVPPSYEHLSEDADDEKLLPHDDCIAERTVRDKALNWRCVFAGFFIGILFSLLVFSTVAYVQPNNKCTQKMTAWSPALEIFNDDDIEIQRFNGTLRVPHEFSAAPSDEIDEKWEKITFAKGGLYRLSKEDVQRIDAPEYAAEYTEEMGGGYMGAFEVFHGLHCLNMLRQATYMDHYLPKNREWREDPETLRFHLG